MTGSDVQRYDDHERALYLVALVVAGRADEAQRAVVGGAAAAYAECDPATTTDREWHRSFARGIHAECRAPGLPDVKVDDSGLTTGSVLPPLLAWVATLDRRQREVLALCAFGGHSVDDAAAVLSMPTSEVLRLLLTALRKVAVLTSGFTSDRS